jgi:hypothetical protein
MVLTLTENGKRIRDGTLNHFMINGRELWWAELG